MRLRDQLPEMRDAIVAAASACGAANLRVFGSVARGEEDAHSDVDVLVQFEAGRTLLDLVRLESRLERLFGRPVDVVTEASLAEPIRSRALREALPV
jgi:predicted nucleotidyltransferase